MDEESALQEGAKDNLVCYHRGCPRKGQPFDHPEQLKWHVFQECSERCSEDCLMWQCAVVRADMELERRKKVRKQKPHGRGSLGPRGGPMGAHKLKMGVPMPPFRSPNDRRKHGGARTYREGQDDAQLAIFMPPGAPPLRLVPLGVGELSHPSPPEHDTNRGFRGSYRRTRHGRSPQRGAEHEEGSSMASGYIVQVSDEPSTAKPDLQSATKCQRCAMNSRQQAALQSMWSLSATMEGRDVMCASKKIVSMARCAVSAQHVALYMIDKAAKVMRVFYEDHAGEIVTTEIPLGQGIVGSVAETSRTVMTDNPQSHPQYDASCDCIGVPGGQLQNCIATPFNGSDETQIAGVLLMTMSRDSFEMLDSTMVDAVANQTAWAIKVAVVNLMRDKLGEMSVRVNSELDLIKVMQMLMDEMRRLMQCDRATLFLLDEKAGELWSALGDVEIRIPRDKGIAGTVCQTGEILNIEDAYKDPRFNQAVDKKTGYKTDTILCYPMIDSAGKSIGVIQLINKLTGVFTKDDEAFLSSISDQAVVAIQTSKQFASINKLRSYSESVMTAITAIVITISPEGHLESCNHIQDLTVLTGHSLTAMRSGSFETWLGEASPLLCADLQQMRELTMNQVSEQRRQSTQSEPGDDEGEKEEMRRARSDSFSAEPDSVIIGAPNDTSTTSVARRRAIIRSNVDFTLPDGKSQNMNYNVMPIMGSSNSRIFSGQGAQADEESLVGIVVTMEDQTTEKRMQQTLSQYMDPSLVDEVLGSSESLLGGTRQPVTVLFADIRRFTALSEVLDSTAVVALLNTYFTTMVDIVLEEKGILDKYIGDAFMAEFGVPFVKKDDACRACRSALKMMAALGKLNKERMAAGEEEICIGIGVNTAMVTVGNIGSQKRMEYTVIGDGVNLASRLEGSTKMYKCSVLLSENTYEEIKDTDFAVRELDRLQVVGKKNAVRIYELLAMTKDELPPEKKESSKLLAEGIELYRSREWVQAREKLQQALDLGDKPASTFIERIDGYIENPATAPGEDWDGVFVSTIK